MTVAKTFPWKFLTFIIIVITSSFLFYDINKHDDWKKSQSVRTLKEVGLWGYGEKAWDGAHQGLNWTRARIEELAPGYIDSASEHLQPYVELSKDLGIVIYNTADTLWESTKEKAPKVRQMIEEYAPGLFGYIQRFGTNTVEIVGYYFNKSYDYLTTQLFVGEMSPENMQKTVINAANTAQKFAVDYYIWAYKKIEDFVDGSK